jgi:phosphatidylserine/phosphatidylglycerophosphate/cardiolipin synthase-like enzyme
VVAVCSAVSAARRVGRILGAILVLCCLLPAAAYPAPEVYFSPGGGVRQRLLQAIEGARRTIDLAIYNLTAAELAEALQAAQARGVQVRILMDRENLDAGSPAIGRLRRSGIPVRALGVPEQSLMHNKFAVFDGRLAVTGSYNWTWSAEHANYENLVVLDDPEVVGHFQREFQRLWLQAKE